MSRRVSQPDNGLYAQPLGAGGKVCGFILLAGLSLRRLEGRERLPLKRDE